MRAYLAGIMACCILAGASWSYSAETIVMVFGGGYPPFYPMGETDGTAGNLDSGMFIEFLGEFEQAHPEYRIRKVRLPRVRMDEWMRTGKAQAMSLNSPLFVRDMDTEHFVFSETIWTTSDHVAVLAGSELAYEEPASLAGKDLGVFLGNGYGPLDPLLESGAITAHRVTSWPQLVRMLEAGRIDAYVANLHVDRHMLREHGYAQDAVRLLEPPIYTFDLGVQVSREAGDFLRDLNAFIRESRDNGVLEGIEKHYMAD